MAKRKFKIRKLTKRGKRNLLIGLLVGLSVLLTLGGALAVFNHFKPNEDGYREIAPVWHIGAIDEETGKIVESNESLYCEINTEELESVKFTLDFDNNIEYTLFGYYLEDEELSFDGEYFTLSESTIYTVQGNDSDVIRVVITPVVEDGEEPVKLNVFNMYNYTKQLTIQVKDLPTEEETEEVVYKTMDITCIGTGCSETITVKYLDGMTWAELVEINDELITRDDAENVYIISGGYYHRIQSASNGNSVFLNSTFDPTYNSYNTSMIGAVN